MSESSGKPRVIVDTNLFVSGTIFKRASPDALLRAWRSRRFILLLSRDQYDELKDVFAQPEISVRCGLSAEDLAQFFDELAIAEEVLPQSDSAGCRPRCE